MTIKENLLAKESSPYLLQHAHNPVNWHPWDEEALTLAKQENKPILLSIGYAACHWCHVMAHESFEDDATAQLMNQYFVNIKVDREERPDLDKIYQTAHHLIQARAGGWPLTVFLNPEDLVPFFAGTYFPLKPRYGILSFKELLVRIHTLFQENKAVINDQNKQLLMALSQLNNRASNDHQTTLDITLFNKAYTQFEDSFDTQQGGFGTAPKFPQPGYLVVLLTTNPAEPFYQSAQKMLDLSLSKMASGGIYDHLGGGFFRYSVDAHWRIPHFEKMLYDNGQLLSIYADAYQQNNNTTYQKILRQTADWALREMLSEKGGFYASLNADSDGAEGKFYCWDKQHVATLLSPEEYTLLQQHFGLDLPANFEGQWHLYSENSLDGIATDQQQKVLYQSAIKKLMLARDKKIRPTRDEKILVSWNALMIKGLAKTGAVLDNSHYITAAQQAVNFIHDNLWKKKRLYACYSAGQAHIRAYLDDYAFLLDSLLTLLSLRWRNKDLTFAIQLADGLLEHFMDEKHGGFFFTAHDQDTVLYRPKPLMDEAMPNGNGVAAFALQRLGHLLGRDDYLAAAEKALDFAATHLAELPHAHQHLLLALQDTLQAPDIVILRGNKTEMDDWHRLNLTYYAPQRLCFAIPNRIKNLPFNLAQYATETATVAYCCRAGQCLAPIRERRLWLKHLQS